ncbi:ATP-binding cassette domain-containing protein [Bradyrhizobium sp. USDA 4529]
MLDVVELSHLAKRYPKQLSGGQQERAFARALASRPAVLLLDEPLSNLDAQLRVRLRDELKRLIAKISVTTIVVTHDQEE